MDAEHGGRARTPRWVKLLLALSLALNLLIVGAVAGFVLRGGPAGLLRDARDPAAPYTRALTETQRDALRRSLRRSVLAEPRADRLERREGILADYRAALDALRADPFDASVLQDALERQTARSEARRQKGQAALAGFLATMSVEERRAFADRLEAEIARFGRRGDGPKPRR